MSSISLAPNDSNNNANTTPPETNILEGEDCATMVDETHLVEKIEAVRNGTDGLAFRIKLIDQTGSKWIPSRIANHKYPQAVITFWESHVEFV